MVHDWACIMDGRPNCIILVKHTSCLPYGRGSQLFWAGGHLWNVESMLWALAQNGGADQLENELSLEANW